MSAPSGAWECRVCGRHVPRHVDECFCGARREQMAALRQREAERTGRHVPFGVVLPLLLIGLVAAYGLDVATREGERPGSASFPAPEAPAPGRIRSGAPPAARPAGAGSDAFPRPAPPPVLDAPSHDAATPDPSPAPVEPPSNAALSQAPAPAPEADQRERDKAAAIEAYEAVLQRLARSASRMAEHVRVYQAECVGQRLVPRITNCGDIEASIRRSITDIETGLETAEDLARRSWVEPGRLRDARARSFFGSREWEDQLRDARQLRR